MNELNQSTSLASPPFKVRLHPRGAHRAKARTVESPRGDKPAQRSQKSAIEPTRERFSVPALELCGPKDVDRVGQEAVKLAMIYKEQERLSATSASRRAPKPKYMVDTSTDWLRARYQESIVELMGLIGLLLHGAAQMKNPTLADVENLREVAVMARENLWTVGFGEFET